MDRNQLRELLGQIRSGSLSVDEAMEKLRRLPFEDLRFARVDHHRSIRQGWPEAIYCEGKQREEILAIARAIVDSGVNLLATRLEPDDAAALEKEIPGIRYNRRGRVAVKIMKEPEKGSLVPILTGGTSDIPVAEEAAETLSALGHKPDRIYDVGVAGIHRLWAEEEKIRSAPAVIVAAGMEGALLSVVGGVTGVPVVGVPTSVGYGTALGGLTPLFGMLNSCASGTTVVNIDNGFGAACAAHRIIQSHQGRE
jgi:NCAIR mutase (PurE)-related protein